MFATLLADRSVELGRRNLQRWDRVQRQRLRNRSAKHGREWLIQTRGGAKNEATKLARRPHAGCRGKFFSFFSLPEHCQPRVMDVRRRGMEEALPRAATRNV